MAHHRESERRKFSGHLGSNSTTLCDFSLHSNIQTLTREVVACVQLHQVVFHRSYNSISPLSAIDVADFYFLFHEQSMPQRMISAKIPVNGEDSFAFRYMCIEPRLKYKTSPGPGGHCTLRDTNQKRQKVKAANLGCSHLRLILDCLKPPKKI